MAMRTNSGSLRFRLTHPGFAFWLSLALVAVAAAALFAMRVEARHSPKGAIRPTPVLNTVEAPVTLTTALAKRAFLSFVPAGAADTLGQAMCAATGTVPCRLEQYPAQVTWRRIAGGRYQFVVVMTVNLRRLLAGGEIDVGHLPGASNLRTGQLAVSTNNSIYGVDMNPTTHRAVFRFDLAGNDEEVWALNWNALGIVSQNSSLQ